MDPNIHSSTVYNSQDMKAIWMSINRQMDKEDAIHTHNRILLSHKEQNDSICSNLDGPRRYGVKHCKSKIFTIKIKKIKHL